MATWYSDHFGADGDNDTSLPSVAKITEAGLKHGRRRRSRMFFKGMPLTTEVVRLGKFRSSDRIWHVYTSSDGGASAGTADIGIYLAGSNHDGAVVDADRFGSAVDLSVALDMVDQFVESTNLTALDRGKRLWELLGLSADSQTEYELCLTVVTSFATADTNILVTVDYLAGD